MLRLAKEVLWILGALTSVPAVISLIQHMGDIGLATTFANFVDFYRSLIRPVFDVLYYPFRPILELFDIPKIPQLVTDLQMLCLVSAWLHMRFQLDHWWGLNKIYPGYLSGMVIFRLLIAFFIVGGLISLLGLAGAMIACLMPWPYRKAKEEEGHATQGYTESLRHGWAGWTVVVATVAFYTANAVALSQ